jgi:hypothetical protein
MGFLAALLITVDIILAQMRCHLLFAIAHGRVGVGECPTQCSSEELHEESLRTRSKSSFANARTLRGVFGSATVASVRSLGGVSMRVRLHLFDNSDADREALANARAVDSPSDKFHSDWVRTPREQP